MSDRISEAYPYGYETWSEKFTRKFKENPWVPLGCAATCGALIMSAAKMRAGKSKEMNNWMRARVGLQGVTLVALVVGSMALRNKKQQSLEAELTREQALQKERQKDEFEERLKEAEEAHSLELAAGRVVKGPALAAKAQNSGTSDKVATEVQTPSSTTPSSTPSSNSWWKLW